MCVSFSKCKYIIFINNSVISLVMDVEKCITLFIILFIGKKGNDFIVKKFLKLMDKFKTFHNIKSV